jgi:SAM-dependent methyltransferase
MIVDNNQHYQTVCRALQNQIAVDFVRTSIKTGYFEILSAPSGQISNLVDSAFEKLVGSQAGSQNPEKLIEVTRALLEDTFHKEDDSFWFNQAYHQYKTVSKPEADFQLLKNLIEGQRLLDYGCGSGYLAARLAKGGYQVYTTDVLDYRYPEAKGLPFVQMASPVQAPYPDDSMDSALVQAVLHHIDPLDLDPVIQGIARMARQVLVKEDSYDLPPHLEGLEEKTRQQPLLQAFIRLPLEIQYLALVLIDFFANAIAQGIPEMNMPYAFHTMSQWEAILLRNGLKVSRVILSGFETGRMHKSCHVWFICERSQ